MVSRQAIRRSGTTLIVIATIGLLWVVGVTLVDLFSTEFLIVLPTEGGFTKLDHTTVSRPQQLVIDALLATPNVCWAWGLIEMIRLGRLCRSGQELTPRAARRFEGFGYALLAMSVCEIITFPLIAAFLRSQNLMNPSIGIWDSLLGGGGIQTFAAAILVALTARIIRLSASLAEESALTV